MSRKHGRVRPLSSNLLFYITADHSNQSSWWFYRCLHPKRKVKRCLRGINRAFHKLESSVLSGKTSPAAFIGLSARGKTGVCNDPRLGRGILEASRDNGRVEPTREAQ